MDLTKEIAQTEKTIIEYERKADELRKALSEITRAIIANQGALVAYNRMAEPVEDSASDPA